MACGLLCKSSWPENILCSSLEARQVAVGGLKVSGMAQQAQTLKYAENSKQRANPQCDRAVGFLRERKERNKRSPGPSEVELLSARLNAEGPPREDLLQRGTQGCMGGLEA